MSGEGMTEYVVVIEQGGDARWTYVPGLPGCAADDPIGRVVGQPPERFTLRLPGRRQPRAASVAVSIADRARRGVQAAYVTTSLGGRRHFIGERAGAGLEWLCARGMAETAAQSTHRCPELYP